jgi:hypothetical protein
LHFFRDFFSRTNEYIEGAAAQDIEALITGIDHPDFRAAVVYGEFTQLAACPAPDAHFPSFRHFVSSP